MGWDQLFGHYDFDDVYGAFVRDARPGFIFVEIGVMFGRSISHLARMAIDAGKRGRIVGVDPWTVDQERGLNREGWGGDFHPQIRDEGGPFNWFVLQMRTHAREELERIEVLRLPSVDAAGAFADGSVDAVWIDGDHRYEAVKADIAAWRKKIRPGGFIGGHDYLNYESVRQAVREAFPQHENVRTSWIARSPLGPPPPFHGSVKDAQQAKIRGWLAAHPLGPCESCSTNGWDIVELLSVPSVVDGVMQIGPGAGAMDVVPFACRQCGCLRFLAAAAIGL